MTSYSDLITRDRPRGYWPMWEQNGTVGRDLTGYQRDGTWQGTPTLGQSRQLDGTAGFTFTGSPYYFDIASNADYSQQTTGVLTIEFLWYPVSHPTNGELVTKDPVLANREWFIAFVGGELWAHCAEASGGTAIITKLTGSAIPAAGLWHHIVVRIPGTSSTSYPEWFDNAAFITPSVTQTGSAGMVAAGSGRVQVGRRDYNTSPDWYSSGIVGHLAIYNYLLSPAQIRRHSDAAHLLVTPRRLHARR